MLDELATEALGLHRGEAQSLSPERLDAIRNALTTGPCSPAAIALLQLVDEARQRRAIRSGTGLALADFCEDLIDDLVRPTPRLDPHRALRRLLSLEHRAGADHRLLVAVLHHLTKTHRVAARAAQRKIA